jgi:hypothetical protein
MTAVYSYIGYMNGLERALEEHLRAQLALLEGYRDRAVAAPDPRLASAWIGHFIRISHAMAATGSAIAPLRHAGKGAQSLLIAPFALPKLPHLPEEGEGVPSQIRKTTPGAISCGNNGLPESRRPRVKSKGGAPRGNPNAQTSGCHTAEFRQFGRALNAYAEELQARALSHRDAHALLHAHRARPAHTAALYWRESYPRNAARRSRPC